MRQLNVSTYSGWSTIRIRGQSPWLKMMRAKWMKSQRPWREWRAWERTQPSTRQGSVERSGDTTLWSGSFLRGPPLTSPRWESQFWCNRARPPLKTQSWSWSRGEGKTIFPASDVRLEYPDAGKAGRCDKRDTGVGRHRLASEPRQPPAVQLLRYTQPARPPPRSHRQSGRIAGSMSPRMNQNEPPSRASHARSLTLSAPAVGWSHEFPLRRCAPSPQMIQPWRARFARWSVTQVVVVTRFVLHARGCALVVRRGLCSFSVSFMARIMPQVRRVVTSPRRPAL